MRVLITAGPTREHLDPVRFLSNGSSGKMGFALAEAAVARGWSVDLVAGPVHLPTPEGVHRVDVVSADEMFQATERLFSRAELFIAVAAVADFKPAQRLDRKAKALKEAHTLELVPTIDILGTLAARKVAGQTVAGFAAETHDVEAYARAKLASRRLDWIVANDVARPGLGMNADDNAVLVVNRNGATFSFGPAPKRAVADFILQTLVSTSS